jgi:tetratricopeptide (TPR) repeat protein
MSRWLPGIVAVSLLGAGVAASAARAPLPAGPKKENAYYLYSLSQQAQFQRNFSDALKYLEEAVRADDCAPLRVELADLYASLNQGSQAEEQARKALSLDPASVEARRLLAQLLLSKGSEKEVAENRLQEAEEIYRALLAEGKADEESVLALADLEMERGEGQAAQATLEGYRSSHPPSAAVDMELARFHQMGGRPDEAVVLLRGVVARNKDNREAWNALGNSLEDEGRFEEAAQAYASLVEQSPGNPYGLYRLAGTLIPLKRYAEAREHLLTALRADPRNVRILLALGRAYEGTHESNLAEGAYRKALENDSGSMEARLFLARLHQNAGEDDEALVFYREVLSRNSARESPPERAFYVLAATQVGIIRLLEKNYPAALDSLGQAFQASEEPSENLYALLGRACLEAGRFEESEKFLAEGREKFPDNLEIPATLGEILLRQSRPEEARGLFRQILERAGGSEEAYLEVIQACLGAKRLAEARPWAEEGARKHPGSRDLEFQAAAIEEQSGRFREAEKKFRELIRKKPEDAEALNYLGYMLADRGTRLQDALALLEKAVGLEPESAAFLDSLGWVHFRLGHYEQAETFLKKAVRGSRPDPTILEHLADAYAALGKVREALETYQAALGRDPDHPEEIRKKMRKLGSSPSAP